MPDDSRIDAAALDAAERFVLLNARLIDRHRFAHLFRGGPAGAVVAALSPYANDDGGFGHGLEPDLRGAASQPEPVAFALRILHELAGPDAGAAFDGPLVHRACDWLASVATPDGGVPWVLPTAVPSPRGPWWQPAEPLVGALVPTASIAGILHAHRVDHPWLATADAFCRRRIDGVARGEVEIGPYDTLALLDLLDHAPDRAWAEQAFGRVREALLATVTLDPAATGHVHRPTDMAPRPGGFGRRLFTDEVMAHHLDLLAAAQRDDGGWDLFWEPWAPATVTEWRGHLTIERLSILRAHGRWAA
ncbi:MAG TPA: hypothetical protein VFZ77_03795 [Acidimicrobiales bacterium]